MSSRSPDAIIEVFGTATEENQISRYRVMQTVHLPPGAEVFMTGDLHDHRRNFDKLLAAADLGSNPQRHLVLHELIHGDHYDEQGAEDSWTLLYRAAELKCDFPDQVHFLLANHDLAQIHGEGISKGGVNVCEAFTDGLRRDFGQTPYHMVSVALTEFLLSLPLAVRTPGGLFFCHSLPTDEQVANFDYTVFERPLNGPDYRRRTGPVYQLIWGRNMSPESVDVFRGKVDADTIVTGHQSQEFGYAVNGDHHLIIASEHNHGVFLPVDTDGTYDAHQLAERLVKFAGVELGEG